MNLVVIYGPPAVGKLTVARELKKITGYKLFHNHMTLEIVNELFDDVNQRRGLLGHLRHNIILAAIASGLPGLIFTYAYQLEDGDEFLDQIIHLNRQGRTLFVQLVCTRRELERRVISESRRASTKTDSIEALALALDSADLFQTFAYPGNLKIDNTELSPAKVAVKIQRYFSL